MKSFQVFTIGFLVLISGCVSTTGEKFLQPPNIEEGKGGLIAFWKPGFSGQLYTARFNLSNREKLKLGNGTYNFVDLSPGIYSLTQIKSIMEMGGKAEIKFEIVEGEITYIQYTQNIGDFHLTGAQLAPFVLSITEGVAIVTSEHALSVLPGLQRVSK